ncbi:hypothetical protein SAMN05216338_100971 [Bradyrhizobium sp. Rc2d]|nr:hypothetical protein SAMN05216338_100971 [Bradyrhizobium sp. Rc2d]
MEAFAEDYDGIKCFRSLCQEYERIMRFASYLLGHMNGLGREIDAAPKFKEFLGSKNSLSQYVIELDNTFDELWDNYGNWTSYEEVDGLGTIVPSLVGTHGVNARVQKRTDVRHHYCSGSLHQRPAAHRIFRIGTDFIGQFLRCDGDIE